MERRNFLKLAFGLAAGGAATLAASAQAAPLLLQSLPNSGRLAGNEDAHPAVTTRRNRSDRTARSAVGTPRVGTSRAPPPLGLAPSS
jgi:hypothetical protein